MQSIIGEAGRDSVYQSVLFKSALSTSINYHIESLVELHHRLLSSADLHDAFHIMSTGFALMGSLLYGTEGVY